MDELLQAFPTSFFQYPLQISESDKVERSKNRQAPFKLRVINFVADTLRKYGLKSQLSAPMYDYIDIDPID